MSVLSSGETQGVEAIRFRSGSSGTFNRENLGGRLRRSVARTGF